MQKTTVRLRRLTAIALVALSAGALTACSSTSGTKSMKAPTAQKRSKEYFAESEYGVKASPRVSTKKSNLKRGGGREQVGKPYVVRGQWYYPKDQPGYSKVGKASWYGSAFHGRLTANGEVYDMTHLTAAHPTLPLPSYARVTNTKNGNSVIVRINDRGPYAHGRLIDLSERAAEMLDYKHSGTAEVKVDYIGRAPLDGNDDAYLMASYKPGNGAPDPSDGLPTGVMIAMNGPTPGAGDAPAAAFPGVLSETAPVPAVQTADVGVRSLETSGVPLPTFGPIAPERPAIAETQLALSMSYAPQETTRGASAAFDVLEAPSASFAAGEPYVAVGTFAFREDAEAMRGRLAAAGQVAIDVARDAGRTWYAVSLRGEGAVDALLEAAWAAGAGEAFVVRD